MSTKKNSRNWELSRGDGLFGASSSRPLERRERVNGIDLYRDEIKSAPILTHEAQATLTRNLQKWKRRRDVLLFTNPMCANELLKLLTLVEKGDLALNDFIDYRREKLAQQEKKGTAQCSERHILIHKLSDVLRKFLTWDEKRRHLGCSSNGSPNVLCELKKFRREMMSLITLLSPKSQIVVRLSEDMITAYHKLLAIHRSVLRLFQQLHWTVPPHLTFETIQAMLQARLESPSTSLCSPPLVGEIHVILSRLNGLMRDVTYTPLDEFSQLMTKFIQVNKCMNRTMSELVQSHQGLVVSQARKYRGTHLDLMDFIQEGNIGLMKAAERFNDKQGSKFSTYAVWWIRQAMVRALEEQDPGVRIPVHMIHTKRAIQRAREKLIQQLGRQPSLIELSEFSEFPLEQIRQINGLLQDQVPMDGLPMNTMKPTRSPYDWLRSHDSSPFDNVVYRELQERIPHMFSLLNAKEQDILNRYYGLGPDMEECDRLTIGKDYGVTRERIRQIENRAFEKLHRSQYVQGLRSYVQVE